jgi:O-antigen/teichoic acid export membrane protein
MVLTIALATQGFGAQSFVLPALLVNPLIAGVLYALTRPPLRWTPEFGKWPGIAKASGFLILAAVFNKVVFQGDYLVLGAVYPEDVVGVYYIAFALSVQPIMLLANNVTNTLFPVLSRLKGDWGRQRKALIRAARVATLVTAPVSVFIATTAEPLVKLFLSADWVAAIPILQILALGMMLRVLEGMTYAFLNAQERFQTIAGLSLLRSVLFFGLAVTAVSFSVKWFAVGVAIAYLLDSIVQIHVALRFSWETLRNVVQIIGLPVVSSLSAGLVGLWFYQLGPPSMQVWNLVSILGIGIIFLVFVLGTTAMLDSSLWAELKHVKSKVYRKLGDGETAEMGA